MTTSAAQVSRSRTQVTRADGSTPRVLVVDDEPSLCELLSLALPHYGWQVSTADNGTTAVTTAREVRPDVVILDMMLPNMDGLQVLRRLRADAPLVPVVFLSARDAVEDRVAGLTAGGDDYVTKPFGLEEVAARLRGLLLRAGQRISDEGRVVVGDLRLDVETHQVTRGEEDIRLTATEFELLHYLMRNPNQVLSKGQILERVWGYDFGGQGNIVELYMSYLRRKIDLGRPPMIHTLRGAGYLIKPAL